MANLITELQDFLMLGPKIWFYLGRNSSYIDFSEKGCTYLIIAGLVTRHTFAPGQRAGN